ncbi:MAG: sialate O-acetylesterase [Opitutales bacterium]|nr:sialate O-acetylesterase [Opitutales bacterium]
MKYLFLLLLSVASLPADVLLPNIFSDHMILQHGQHNPVWGRADAGELVRVTIAGQSHETVADSQGTWRVELEPMAASHEPKTLQVSGIKSQLSFTDVLVGEVWMCSGQSNMAWSINATNDYDMEIATADYPEIRLLSVPRVGTQDPQFDIEAQWKVCTPENVKDFSGPGYLFGRRLHTTLKVPVGLIYNAWGGSDLEAWLPRKVLEDAGQDAYLAEWDEYISKYSDAYLERQKVEYQKWLDAGKPGKKKFPARDVRTAQKRPANIFNGVLHPTIGYGIKGVIWCQGESNIGRAYEYRSLFPLLINTWRDLWAQDDLPFYWIQLADHNVEKSQPAESYWAELREAQTMALSLPNTGEAVVIDIGEARDIHYRNKQEAASRLVRHALANEYGYKIATSSPRYQSMEVDGNTITLTFDHVATHLYAFDVPEVKGFAIAGADKKFVWAQAEIIGKNKVKVWSDQIADPAAVRYGWADNPVVNRYDRNSLPVTPFRTDDWPIGTMGNKTMYRPMPD